MPDSLGPITGSPSMGEHVSFEEKLLNTAGQWNKLSQDEKIIYSVATSIIGVFTLGLTHGLYHIYKHVYSAGDASQATTAKTKDVLSESLAPPKPSSQPFSLVSSPHLYNLSTSVATESKQLELVQKEVGEKLHNYNVQTKIEIAVLKAYGHKNPKLSSEDKQLLRSYVGKLEEISQFDEKMLEELRRVRDQGGGSQEVLNVYHSFWGEESSGYAAYAKNVGELAKLMPRLSALLLDTKKLSEGHKTPFSSFDRFVTSIARRSKIKGLLNLLIMSGEGQLRTIDSTIKYPAEKASGAIYAQWMSRVKDLLGAVKKTTEKAGGDTSLITATLENAKAKVDLVNKVLVENG